MEHFEQARQSLEQQPTQEATPQPEASGSPTQETQTQEAKSQAIADLMKFDKVLLDGEELSPAELKKQRMFEADYRRKTMEHSEKVKQFEQSSKFATALPKDLDVLLEKPWLASEFYKIYPPEYHAHAKRIEQMYRQNPGLWTQGETQSDNSQDIEKIIEERINQRLKPIEEREELAQQKASLAAIDAIEAKLSKKYEEANKFEVYAMAEYMAKDGNELSDKDWEKIYKDSHDRNLARIEKRQASRFNKQKETNQTLQDVAPGGAVPGEAPVVAKNFREAKDMLMKSLGGS